MDRKAGNTIIIKRKKVVAGGHHGGAWKVAYADFVTAMMAFFLLMWLLSTTDEETRLGLADYFSPTIPIHSRAAAAATGRSTARACSARTCWPRTRPGRRATRRRRTCRRRPTRASTRSRRRCSAAAATRWRPNPLLEHIRTRVTDEGLIIEVFDIDGSPLFDGPTADAEPDLRAAGRDDRPGAGAHDEPGRGVRAPRDRRRGRGGPDPWSLSSDRAQLARELAGRVGRRGRAARPGDRQGRPRPGRRTTRATPATGGSRSRCCGASTPQKLAAQAVRALALILSRGPEGCRPDPTRPIPPSKD